MKFTVKDKYTLASNMSLGATSKLIDTNKIFTSKEQSMITNACKATVIKVCGIDFIKLNNDIYIIELNNSPDLATAYKAGKNKHLKAIV